MFRGNAAFGKPEVYEYLEQEKIGYAIRLSANAVLQREIAHLLVRPAEWCSRRPIVSYHDFLAIARLNQALLSWEEVYNRVRPHQSLDGRTPVEYLQQCHPELVPSLLSQM